MLSLLSCLWLAAAEEGSERNPPCVEPGVVIRDEVYFYSLDSEHCWACEVARFEACRTHFMIVTGADDAERLELVADFFRSRLGGPDAAVTNPGNRIAIQAPWPRERFPRHWIGEQTPDVILYDPFGTPIGIIEVETAAGLADRANTIRQWRAYYDTGVPLHLVVPAGEENRACRMLVEAVGRDNFGEVQLWAWGEEEREAEDAVEDGE